MLTANSDGFFTVPSHRSQLPLPYLTKNTALLPEQCFLHKVYVRDVDPAAHRATSCIGLPHLRSSCQPKRLQHSRPGLYMWAWEQMSITQTTCLLDRWMHLQWGSCRQGGLPHSYNTRRTASQQHGSCSCIAAFSSCHFKAEVLLLCVSGCLILS